MLNLVSVLFKFKVKKKSTLKVTIKTFKRSSFAIKVQDVIVWEISFSSLEPKVSSSPVLLTLTPAYNYQREAITCLINPSKFWITFLTPIYFFLSYGKIIRKEYLTAL